MLENCIFCFAGGIIGGLIGNNCELGWLIGGIIGFTIGYLSYNFDHDKAIERTKSIIHNFIHEIGRKQKLVILSALFWIPLTLSLVIVYFVYFLLILFAPYMLFLEYVEQSCGLYQNILTSAVLLFLHVILCGFARIALLIVNHKTEPSDIIVELGSKIYDIYNENCNPYIVILSLPLSFCLGFMLFQIVTIYYLIAESIKKIIAMYSNKRVVFAMCTSIGAIMGNLYSQPVLGGAIGLSVFLADQLITSAVKKYI